MTGVDSQGASAAEARLRRVLDTAGDAYVAVDHRGCVTEWNHAAASMFGWSREEAAGRSLTELIVPPELAAAHVKGFARYRATGVPHILGAPVQVPAQRRDGTTFPVEITVWELVEESEHAFHAFLRDVTARVDSAAELQRSNDDLQAFAAMAAHDLRSPLTVARSYAEILRALVEEEGYEPVRAAPMLDRIITAADRGMALIEQLLAYATIGQGSLVMEAVDLATLVEAVVEDQTSLTSRPAEVSVQVAGTVEGSPTLLGQLLGNLVGNAVKYVPQDRAVRIDIDSVSRPPDRLVVRVADNGDPIDPEDRRRLFTIFERGRGEVASGSGVGLAICQRVAEAHGGEISFDADYHQGNRVSVTLPLAQQAS